MEPLQPHCVPRGCQNAPRGGWYLVQLGPREPSQARQSHSADRIQPVSHILSTSGLINHCSKRVEYPETTNFYSGQNWYMHIISNVSIRIHVMQLNQGPRFTVLGTLLVDNKMMARASKILESVRTCPCWDSSLLQLDYSRAFLGTPTHSYVHTPNLEECLWACNGVVPGSHC